MWVGLIEMLELEVKMDNLNLVMGVNCEKMLCYWGGIVL